MSAPSWAVPGAKVVCIDAEPLPNSNWRGDAPQKGCVYTISRIWTNPDTGRLNCELNELQRNPLARSWGWGYALQRFRPLVERTQEDDIALFKHLLNTTPASEDA